VASWASFKICYMASFDQTSLRLKYLEIWKEIAIRPTTEECHEDDKDLLSKQIDDLTELSKRCLIARGQLNANLPPHELALDDSLIVQDSGIPNAGKGLFFNPPEDSDIIPCESTICYYTGHWHNNFSQKYLTDKSYLLNVAGDLFVDPGPMLSIKARYINDPLNPVAVNCTFVPDPKNYRCSVVATRDIKAKEEVFVSYGEFYWSQQAIRGTVHSQHCS